MELMLSFSHSACLWIPYLAAQCFHLKPFIFMKVGFLSSPERAAAFHRYFWPAAGILQSGPQGQQCCWLSLLPDSPQSSNITAWPQITLSRCVRVYPWLVGRTEDQQYCWPESQISVSPAYSMILASVEASNHWMHFLCMPLGGANVSGFARALRVNLLDINHSCC